MAPPRVSPMGHVARLHANDSHRGEDSAENRFCVVLSQTVFVVSLVSLVKVRETFGVYFLSVVRHDGVREFNTSCLSPCDCIRCIKLLFGLGPRDCWWSASLAHVTSS